MEKKCVFCGQSPSDKNKEHILPKWLLSLTGDPNRVVQITDQFKFSFSSLTLPACEICNTKYSELEVKAKQIVEILLSKQELFPEQIITLLDWLDKVRIGIWLNIYYLEKNKAQIEPKFSIDTRIGKKDRFLQVYFLQHPEDKKGLSIIGAESILFQLNPSCFGMLINNKILIINASNDFLVSKSCGFPYPQNMLSVDNSKLQCSNFTQENNTLPQIEGINFYNGVMRIMQPIHTFISYPEDIEGYNTIKDNCIDFENKVGTLFYLNKDTMTPIHNFEDTISYQNDTIRIYIIDLIVQIYEAQNIFSKRFGDLDFFKPAIDINNIIIQQLKNLPTS